MVDRRIIYPGAIPQETDLLFGERAGVQGLGSLATALFGNVPIIDGLRIVPNSPADTTVIVQPGSVYFQQALDATAFSTLPADGHAVTQQGLLRDPLQLTVTPPTTPGNSRVYLVQTTVQVVDTDPTTLPYYNAADPSVALSGPDGSGTPQNTTRAVRAVVGLKAGVSAPTGSQVTPGADPGWVGIGTVTVANGTTSITSANIANVVGSPRLDLKVGQAQDYFQALLAAAGLALDPASANLPVDAVRAITTTMATPTKVTGSGSVSRNPRGLFYYLRAIGGGGGGGGATGGASGSAGGGGGHGGISEGWFQAADLPATMTITVGAPGEGGQFGANGTAGGSTTIAGVMNANGGASGEGAANGLVGGGGIGGNAAGGLLNIVGQGGNAGFLLNNSGVGGQGGSGPLGAGGVLSFPSASSGAVASGYGAGGAGGGASTNGRIGGRGAAGVVVIIEFRGS